MRCRPTGRTRYSVSRFTEEVETRHPTFEESQTLDMFEIILRRMVFTIGVVLGTELTCLAVEKPVSVCDVLSNLDRYRGRLITVRGILRGGTRHGWFLEDNIGDKPCASVGGLSRTWPPDIALAQFTFGSDLEDGPASFQSDTLQIDAMLSEPKRLVQGRTDLMIVVTLTGELRSRKGIRISRTKEGWYEGDGYAQSGQYPALLVIKKAESVRVVEK